eukprot:50440-Prymnesium_polylepis.2
MRMGRGGWGRQRSDDSITVVSAHNRAHPSEHAKVYISARRRAGQQGGAEPTAAPGDSHWDTAENP